MANLEVLDSRTSRICENDTGTIGSEIEYIERLLKVVNIEGFEVSHLTPKSPNMFTLRRMTPITHYVNENLLVKTHLFEKKNLLLLR